ncbi:MAG: methionine adenosyltransferase [Nitrososphaerales archaeon]|nr:methionine adenosyltransferase [Nitrososphaerales archaeon]
MTNNFTFTSESVSSGHPDKVADQISDALVDAALSSGDETTRCGIETANTTNYVLVFGETKNFNPNNEEVESIIRNKVREIGYEQEGFHWEHLKVDNLLHNQSADIALGVDDFGAGDQGLMFGYACKDTPSLLPAPIHYSHEILKHLRILRDKNPDILGPDSKSQVSVVYRDNVPAYIDKVVVSTQHSNNANNSAKEHAETAILEACGDLIDRNRTEFLINPTGNFVIGGPQGDSGITGRKIIVDTYGGYAPHGGGAFSGKDPTKVDRSAAYMARWIAKNVVLSELADWCSIQLSYAIGVKEPTSLYVDSNGDNQSISDLITKSQDLTPLGIIRKFDLFNFTEYSKNCVYGHFGDKNVPWEKTEKF